MHGQALNPEDFFRFVGVVIFNALIWQAYILCLIVAAGKKFNFRVRTYFLS